MDIFKHTTLIKNKAYELGFDACGIAKVEELNEDRQRLEQWLNKGYHGNMKYMEKHIDLRSNPKLLVDNAQSVITLTLNYYPEKQADNPNCKISKYAYGDDYHIVIKEKLFNLLQYIKENIGNINGRGFVDSAPVFEKAWAIKSGIGWIGKNGNLIKKKVGSFFFIANLIVDIKLEYDAPITYDHCGKCTLCIDSCPTQAILPNKVINAQQCISYYTIELKHTFKEAIKFNAHDWIFGCDICQDVCPWNKFVVSTQEEKFKNINTVINFSIQQWLNLDKKAFNKLLKNSPIKRTKFEGIQMNAENILK